MTGSIPRGVFAQGVTKRFKTGRTHIEVLKQVDFEARPGHVTMVMGPSGSGKSTLIAALSGLLRSIVEVKLTSVDQLTYSEFVFSLENPTCFNLLRAAPLEGNLILDINPSIVYPIIDRLLGGGRESAPWPGAR